MSYPKAIILATTGLKAKKSQAFDSLAFQGKFNYHYSQMLTLQNITYHLFQSFYTSPPYVSCTIGLFFFSHQSLMLLGACDEL